ncbi:MAG: regulatory protein RecX [Candidatus Omnitrophota bacterium]
MAPGSKDDLAKAKNIVFHLLKYRARSQKEIQDRLRQKNFSQTTIDQVIDFCYKLDLIDDEAFASSWLNSRLRKPFGLRRIFFELKTKGISEEIIEQAQYKIKDNYNEYEVVLELAKERLSKLKRLEPDKAKGRVYGFLMRRGFSPDIVNEVIREL